MEARIEKIVHGGFGVARLEGGTCLVPFSAPGDVLDIGCSKDRGVRFGWIKGIVEPSPYRRESKCPVYGVCGGCDFDHVDYGCELAAKRGILIEDLARIAKTRFEELDDTVSALEYGYRNHSQFKVDAQGNPGFFAKKSHEVIPLPAQGCLLLEESITKYVGGLIGKVAFRKGGFRVRANTKGDVFKKGIPGILDDSHCFYYLDGLAIRVRIDDFFQVNRFLIERWMGKIEEYLEPEPGDTVADLYCGSGIIGLAVAPLVRSVLGIEMNRNALQSARYNARWNGIDNVSFFRSNAARADTTIGILARERVNKIVVDPPRSGLSEALVEGMCSLRPGLIVYASCNTATFARDVASFVEHGYVIRELAVVDMFPRTRHVEVVSMLVRGTHKA